MGLISQAKNPLVKSLVEQAKNRGFETQKELANETKVSHSTINRLLHGRGISLDNLYKILTYFDLLKIPGNESEETTKLYKELAEERKFRIAFLNKDNKYNQKKRKNDPPDLNVLELRVNPQDEST